MPSTVWKEYEENPLTHSAAHYLMTIHELLQSHGYARVTDIAKRMNITRGSCSIGLRPLKRRGLVVEDENKFLSLSDEGLRMAALVERNDELLETFLRDILGVDADQAEIDACKMEHLLSIETSMRLASFVALFEQDHSAARGLLAALRSQGTACTHDAANCALCENLCFLDIKPAGTPPG